jgi:signal transduction histidine kinase
MNSRISQLLVFAFCLPWLIPGGHIHVSGQAAQSGSDVLVRVEALIQMAKEERNNRLAVELADQAVHLSDSLGEDLLAAKAYLISGTAWRAAGDYLMAYEMLQEAYRLFNAMELYNEANIVKRQIGETFRAGGAFVEFNPSSILQGALEVTPETRENFRGRSVFELAMRLFSEAKTHFLVSGEDLELAKTLNRMAATAFEMTTNHPAFSAWLESIEPSASAFTKGIEARPELMRMHDQTWAYLDSATTMARQLNDHALIISNENIRAALYALEYKTSMSLQKYDEIMEFMHETGHTDDLPLVMINKARSLGAGWLNRYEDAIELALEALEQAKELNTAIYVILAHELLHKNYLALGDYEKAYYHYFENTQFSFLQQGTLLLLKTNAQEYEFQIKQRETEISHRQRLFKTVAIMGGIIIMTFSVFLIMLGIKNRDKRQLLVELNNKNLQISNQNEELTEANTSKDRLFSIISHDLRNPFNTILGYSDLLKSSIEEYDNKEARKFASHINMAAEQTLNLLNNLLQWAKIQRKQLRYQPEEVDLILVSEEVRRFGNEMAGTKNLHLVNHISPGLKVLADREMLKTILRNLLGNAIKFSNAGGKIILSAQTTTRETIICVEDNGIGIQKELAKSLFDPNENHSKPGTSGEEGTGLGLVVCKEFVEMHGGKIWMESTPGAGSTFCFSIPLK